MRPSWRTRAAPTWPRLCARPARCRYSRISAANTRGKRPTVPSSARLRRPNGASPWSGLVIRLTISTSPSSRPCSKPGTAVTSDTNCVTPCRSSAARRWESTSSTPMPGWRWSSCARPSPRLASRRRPSHRPESTPLAYTWPWRTNEPEIRPDPAGVRRRDGGGSAARPKRRLGGVVQRQEPGRLAAAEQRPFLEGGGRSSHRGWPDVPPVLYRAGPQRRFQELRVGSGSHDPPLLQFRGLYPYHLSGNQLAAKGLRDPDQQHPAGRAQEARLALQPPQHLPAVRPRRPMVQTQHPGARQERSGAAQRDDDGGLRAAGPALHPTHGHGEGALSGPRHVRPAVPRPAV